MNGCYMFGSSPYQHTTPCPLQVALPKGRILAICPWESHHDSGMYPDAWRFNPDRAPLALGDGSAVVHSVAGMLHKALPGDVMDALFEQQRCLMLCSLMCIGVWGLTPSSTYLRDNSSMRHCCVVTLDD